MNTKSPKLQSNLTQQSSKSHRNRVVYLRHGIARYKIGEAREMIDNCIKEQSRLRAKLMLYL